MGNTYLVSAYHGSILIRYWLDADCTRHKHCIRSQETLQCEPRLLWRSPASTGGLISPISGISVKFASSMFAHVAYTQRVTYVPPSFLLITFLLCRLFFFSLFSRARRGKASVCAVSMHPPKLAVNSLDDLHRRPCEWFSSSILFAGRVLLRHLFKKRSRKKKSGN